MVFVPVAKTLVSSPSGGPRAVIAVFPRQPVAASGFWVKCEPWPLRQGIPGEGGAPGHPRRPSLLDGAARLHFGAGPMGQRGNFGFAVPGVQLRGTRPPTGTMAGSRELRAAPCRWPGTASSRSRRCLHRRSSLAISIALSGGEEGCFQPSSFLPQRDVGWAGRGGERIFLAGGCAIGEITAF